MRAFGKEASKLESCLDCRISGAREPFLRAESIRENQRDTYTRKEKRKFALVR